MNKSKFLKRSLAAILAILMVVAMVPSALAVQVVNESVPTARVFNDPGYLISVGGDRAVWDADNGAYKVSTTFNEGNAIEDFKVSMIEVDRNTVTVKETEQVLGATVEELDPDKAVKSVDSFGVGTYTYTLVAVVTDANGDTISTNEYKLIIDLTMKTKSSDATIKAVKSVKLPYAVSAKYDNAKNTIDIVMALGKKNHHDTSDTLNGATAAVEDIFVPTSDTATSVAYTHGTDNDGKATVTVTAENGDTKVYAVSFTEEAAFDTFKVGDFEGKAVSTDPKKIIIDLPYEYLDGSAIAAAKVTELEKMIASWTVSTGSKVYIGGTTTADIKESGKETLTIDNSTDITDTDIIGTTAGEYIARKVATAKQISVKTKKSGDTPVSVDVFFRVPAKNPDAELTGIQIIKGDGDITDPAATDYTQYKAIDKGSRNITIDLPTTMKKTDTDLYIHVWGAKNSKIELAEGRTGSNAFETADENGLELSTDKSSDTAINVSKPITLKVVSEDTKTTLLYNVTVNNSNGGSASLTSLKVVNAKGEDVGATVSSLSNKAITITLPYKYGTNTPNPKDLVVTASGSNSAKVSYTDGEVAGEAVAAVYTSGAQSQPSVQTSNDSAGTETSENVTITICGFSAPAKAFAIKGSDDDGDGTYTYDWDTDNGATLAAMLAYYVEEYNKDSSNDKWTASVGGDNNDEILFTAVNAGAIDGNGPATADIPSGASQKTPGAEAGVAGATWTPFVKDATLGALTAASGNITLPLASADATGASGANPNVDNVFTLRVNNGSANGDNLYVVTLKKADPSTSATITSAKVTSSVDTTITSDIVEYGSTVNTRTGRDTSTIKVNELPYSFKDTTTAAFSELKLSDEAHVVIGTTEITFDDGETSKGFTINALSNAANWSKEGKEIKVCVFSEKDWYDSAKANAGSGLTNADNNVDNATKVYKMSATYAAAGTGAELTSIASTLDETIKVDKVSKTVTITVPASYVSGGTVNPAGEVFTLDIKTSPFAGIEVASISGSTITNNAAVTPDEGDSDKVAAATKFIVKKNGDNYELHTAKGDNTPDTNAYNCIVVKSQDTNNTSVNNVVVKVAPVETSNAIESITVAGKTATKGADGETWDLVLPVDADLVQLVDIKTASKLATVEVDGVPYDAENYYDLGDDLSIKVTAENGEAFTYTLKTVREGINTNTDIADIRAGAYNATRGTGNAWTIQVPEGTDMSNPSLTVRTVVDGAKVTSVNGEAYTDGMTVDLSEGKTLTIVVTALDGTTTGTHTVTCQFGDKKPAEEYHDIPAGGMGEWVTKAINYGLMSNTGANDEGKLTFGPNDRVERKYFALMVARADVMANDATITDKDAADEKLKSLYSGTPAFSDAPANDETVNAALEYCKTNGIISGYEDGTFKPNNYVGRTEAASILVGWLKLPDAGEENTNNFKDWNAIGWAHGKVNSVVKAGVMSGIGDGYFGTGTLTREQTAVILTRAFENLRDSK